MKMRMDALLVYLEMCYIFADVHSISGKEMKGKIKSLDGLRAIAVFIVIIQEYIFMSMRLCLVEVHSLAFGYSLFSAHFC